MAKSRSVYVCSECGAQSPQWLGRCPGCGKFGTLVEEISEAPAPQKAAKRERSASFKKPVPLSSVHEEAVGRVCAQTCGLFPPCMPVLLPGDVVSGDAARRLSGAVSAFGLSDGKIIVFED